MPDTTSTVSPSQADGPPEAPLIRRRLALAPHRVVLLLVPFSVVLLALLGVFGNSSTTVHTGERGLVSMTVSYPSRIRHERIMPLQIEVRNESGNTFDTLSVSIDESYLGSFSQVDATPSPSAPGTFELYDVAPGERRQIDIEFNGNESGRHKGAITASARGLRLASVDLSTFTFP